MIGKITETNVENVLTVKGYIRTYAIALNFKLEPRDSMRDDRSPTHNVVGRGVHGEAFHAGVAWQGTNKNNGERMYSLALNVPELFKDELRLVAWENNKEPGNFELHYSKDKETTQQQATAA